MTTTKRTDLQPHVKQRDVVSSEELAARGSSGIDFEPQYFGDGEEVVLLDPIVAELAEADRYRRAPRRHRVTAEDLDRRSQ